MIVTIVAFKLYVARGRRTDVARWTDVRVSGHDATLAWEPLSTAFNPLMMEVDTQPPGAGAEIEFRLQDHAEGDVRAVLERAGVPVLASREQLRPRVAREEA